LELEHEAGERFGGGFGRRAGRELTHVPEKPRHLESD
jgi:hypothetical protein